MKFRILGPVVRVVDDEGTPIHLTKQAQQLVAVLLAQGGRVSAAELQRMLWEEESDRRRRALTTAIFRLRGCIGDNRLLTFEDAGSTFYQLRVEPSDWVDLRIFRTLVQRAEQAPGADPEVEAGLYGAAVKEWPDPHLSAFPRTKAAEPLVVGLDRLRSDVLTRWVEVRLDLGQHAELCRELPALRASYPGHELLIASEMLALYRSGRKGAAIALYEETAAQLRRKQGTEPGVHLQGVYQQVQLNKPELHYRPLPPRETDQQILASGATNEATPFRMTQHMLGLEGSLPADRLAVELVKVGAPEIVEMPKANELFVTRAIRTIVAQSPVNQWIELLMGVPTPAAPHVLARRMRKGTRVVYVSADRPSVILKKPEYTDAITGMTYANLRMPSVTEIMEDPEVHRLIRTDEPVGIIMRDIPTYLPDDSGLIDFIAKLLGQFPSGSYLVISVGSSKGLSDRIRQQIETIMEGMSWQIVWRTERQVRKLLGGIPGLTWLEEIRPLHLWRSDLPDQELVFHVLSGVARTD